MSEFFEDFMQQRKDWKLKISPSMQEIIDKTTEIGEQVESVVTLFDQFYPGRSSDGMSNPIIERYNAMLDEIEKRAMRIILCDTEHINYMKQD